MPATWKTALRQLLSPPQSKAESLPRIAVLGVGNEMRADDAAGLLVARALAQRGSTDGLIILEAGPAPENQAGELRRFAPDLVLIIDAADLHEAPGTVRLISEESIDGMSASTHSLPLSMLAHYLRLELNCTVVFLGIQPGSVEVGRRVSPGVLQAIHQVVDELDPLTRMRD